MRSHPDQALAPSKPFLKWAGGKSRLLPALLPLLPAGRRLVEPFVGAGSVLLASNYDSYVINDANPDLVAVWLAVKRRPRQFADLASQYFTEAHRSQDAYLRVRDEFNSEEDAFERAVRLPYLNRFGFNGLYRVNRYGGFNVPYGKPERLPAFPWDELAAASERLSRCTVLNGGFAFALEQAGAGDVVYCDPPYLDSHAGASFTGYTSSRFGLGDHEQLVASALAAVGRGARVLISNHDTLAVRELYKGWKIDELLVRRSVGRTVESRRLAREIVASL